MLGPAERALLLRLEGERVPLAPGAHPESRPPLPPRGAAVQDLSSGADQAPPRPTAADFTDPPSVEAALLATYVGTAERRGGPPGLHAALAPPLAQDPTLTGSQAEGDGGTPAHFGPGGGTSNGRIAIRAAEQAGRVLGPRAAYSALRTLALTLEAPHDRMAALLSAGGVAAQLGDEAALLSLAPVLVALGAAQAAGPPTALTSLCAQLLDAHRPRIATALADAEVQRAPRSEAHYLLGRCLHEHSPAAADAAYAQAASQPASPEPANEETRRAARHQRRLLALALRLPAPTEALEADPPNSPAQALSDAAARLSRGGRYARALAIDQLAELARDVSLADGTRRSALRLLSRYADQRGERITPVESERLDVALVAHDPSLSRVSAQRRTWFATPQSTALAVHMSPNAAQAIAALLASDKLADAVKALRQARADSAGSDAPGSLYAAAWLALRSEDAEVAREGRLLVEELLAESTRPPTGGFLRLAAALASDHPTVAQKALERAAARDEPGARLQLGAILVEQAWRAYAVGDREGALSALRRADRLTAEAVLTSPATKPIAPPAGPGVADRDDPRTNA